MQSGTEDVNNLLSAENSDDQTILFGGEDDLSNNTGYYYDSILSGANENIETETVFEQIDYKSICNSDADVNDADAELIKQKLNSLIETKPEMNISDIYKLRFEQKKTISEIAEELNIERKDIIAAIEEIVDLI